MKKALKSKVNGKNEGGQSSKAEQNGVAVKDKKKKVKSLKSGAEKSNKDNNGTVKGNGGLPFDDLKEVNGIGPKLEKVLNKKGITTFSQLSELDVKMIFEGEDEAVAIVGRVEREDWVGQARELMKKGDGKSK